MVAESKGNPQLQRLVRELHHKGREPDGALWAAAARHLLRPRHQTRPVNVGHLERVTSPKEILLVPTKLLASGKLKKPLTVAALAVSPGAREKVVAAGGTVLTLQELMAQHPQGKGVRLLA